MLSQLGRACRLLKGVTAVKVRKTKDCDMDITKTAGYREAMDDVRKGRVYRYTSIDDLFKELDIPIG